MVIRTTIFLCLLMLLGCDDSQYLSSQNSSDLPDYSVNQDIRDFHRDALNKGSYEFSLDKPYSPIAHPFTQSNLFFDDKASFDESFIGIAISGGGARASNFSAAILEELDKMGVLEHIDVISSVSGGSITAAYHALNYKTNDETYWKSIKSKLRTNFLNKWISKLLNPVNIIKLSLTDYDRSDIMAEVFDEVLYNGAKFEDFNDKINRTYINSSRLTRNNESFIFSPSEPALLDYPLAKYPVSYSVTASAAFPLILNSVALEVPDLLGEELNFMKQVKLYDHIFDGGPADNLGIETIRQSAINYYRSYLVNKIKKSLNEDGRDSSSRLNKIKNHVDNFLHKTKQFKIEPNFSNGQIEASPADQADNMLRSELGYRFTSNGFFKKNIIQIDERILDNSPCLLIVIDSSTQESGFNTLQYSSDASNLDGNIIATTDIMMNSKRTYDLNSIGISNFSQTWLEPLENKNNSSLGVFYLFDSESGYSQSRNIYEKNIICISWHLSIAHHKITDSLDIESLKLPAAYSSVKTNFYLTGIDGCSPDQIQDVIYDTAKNLIANDPQKFKINHINIKNKYCNSPSIKKFNSDEFLEVDSPLNFFTRSDLNISAKCRPS